MIDRKIISKVVKSSRSAKLLLPSRLLALCGVVVVCVVAGVILTTYSHAASGNGTLYITPSSGSYSVGDTLTLTVRENSGSTAINAVEADLTYPSNLLQYESYSVGASAFNYAGPAPSLGSGTFKYAILDTGTLTGDQEVLTISFKALGNGSVKVGFASTAAVIDAGTNQNATPSGASLTLTTPVTPPPNNPPPPSNPNPPNNPSSTPGTTSKKSSSTGIAVTPSGGSTPVTVPSGAEVELNAPASVQPSNGASSYGSVVKAQYYLDNKLLATVTHAPFTYKLQTDDILNGNYTFTTKTYYASGNVVTSSQNLKVSNPESLKQILLVAKKYSAPGISTLILIAIALFLLLRWRHIVYAIRYFREKRSNLITATEIAQAPVVQSPSSGVAPPEQPGYVPPTVTGTPPPPQDDPVPSVHPPVQAPGSVYQPQPQQPENEKKE